MAPNRLYDDERITDPTTLAVYGAVAHLGRDGKARASYEEIGKHARCSRRTAMRHVALLVELGYLLTVSRTGGMNDYALIDQKGDTGDARGVPRMAGGSDTGDTPVRHTEFFQTRRTAAAP